MRPELASILQELAALAGGARPYVLPMPYKRGHFRIFCEKELPKSEDFTAVRSGNNLFMTITDRRLMQALAQMETSVVRANVQPQASVLDTLLYQLLLKDYPLNESQPDCPELVRLALDLDEDAQRSLRVIRQMEPLMSRAYAEALRENRKYSVLSAVARQVVYYRNLYHI